MLTIYGRANSINVRKVLWACGELGLAFERHDFGRGFTSTDTEAFRRISTFGVVPVLEDDGFILRESNVIVRYLCDREGRTDLLPSSPRERFTVESWMDWAATDLYVGVRPAFQGIVFKLPQFDKPDVIAAGIADWTRQMLMLEDHLASGAGFVVGETMTAADIPVGLTVNRWYATPFDDKPELPATAAYYERLKTRPAFQEYGANGLP
ncbi:MAG: glutathione S-transferase family protein [Pseudomonadota bacterium]